MKRRTTSLALATAILLTMRAVAPAATFTTIDDPGAAGGFGTVALGISGNNVVGMYYDASQNQYGFEYNTATNIWTNLRDPLAGPINMGGATIPQGISGNEIVGAFNDANNDEHGFLYNGTSWTTLDDPSNNDPAGGTFATGISGNYVVGYYYTRGTDAHGFVYNTTTNAWTNLDGPGADNTGTFVWGINGSNVVGQYEDASGNGEGFIYNIATSTWDILPYPEGNFFAPRGISGNSLVSWATTTTGSGYLEEAAVYDLATSSLATFEDPSANEMLSVDNGTTALGIDGDSIVGWYSTMTSNGQPFLNGYVAVVPEPPSAVLLALAVIGLGIAAAARRGLAAP